MGENIEEPSPGFVRAILLEYAIRLRTHLDEYTEGSGVFHHVTVIQGKFAARVDVEIVKGQPQSAKPEIQFLEPDQRRKDSIEFTDNGLSIVRIIYELYQWSNVRAKVDADTIISEILSASCKRQQ